MTSLRTMNKTDKRKIAINAIQTALKMSKNPGERLEHQTDVDNTFRFYSIGEGSGSCEQSLNGKQVNVEDFSPRASRKAYIKALFLENRRWIVAIEKYQMMVSGSPKNAKDKARDLAAKEHLQDQISADTYADRKAFYTGWCEAPCCADDCNQYCDQCSNGGIKFKSVPAYGLDTDVRRYITDYGRYQTASELEAELKEKEESNVGKQKSKWIRTAILSGVCDRKSDNDPVWIRGQEGSGLFGESEKFTSDQAKRIEEMLSHPFSEEMVT